MPTAVNVPVLKEVMAFGVVDVRLVIFYFISLVNYYF
jgi:hypothetical protein